METLIGEGMFTLGKRIGSGAFGTIYEGKIAKNTKKYQECGEKDSEK